MNKRDSYSNTAGRHKGIRNTITKVIVIFMVLIFALAQPLSEGLKAFADEPAATEYVTGQDGTYYEGEDVGGTWEEPPADYAEADPQDSQAAVPQVSEEQGDEKQIRGGYRKAR